MDTSPEGVGGGIARKREQRPANCPEHGAFDAINIVGRVWSSCPACALARRAAEKLEDEARERRRAEDKHRALLASAAIPQRFIGRTFENFSTPTDRHAHAQTVFFIS